MGLLALTWVIIAALIVLAVWLTPELIQLGRG
jgi:hypothetical protein